ncbi:hypothetical protein GYMLUDRAFT_56597 [Collybiopsis luxurians FD-317 M1]|nr:hypothetical protein GYMLUDRAFT_56597 [Collybiopsis luxurians FD-317 M1]
MIFKCVYWLIGPRFSFPKLVSRSFASFPASRRYIYLENFRGVVGAKGPPNDWLSIPAEDGICMKDAHDCVEDRLLTENRIYRIQGGFQYHIRSIEALVSFRKGMALGATPDVHSSIAQFEFPQHAEDFPPGMYFDLRLGWYWTMESDFTNSYKVPVRFSALPTPTTISKRPSLVLEKKITTFCTRKTSVVSWIYWFFEPPRTLKVGRTVNLARRMLEWNRKCPNPLRVWCGAFVTSCGTSLETLIHWKMEQMAYDRPTEDCWSCGVTHREVFITVAGIEAANDLALSIVREMEELLVQ